jgi:histone H3/H4
MKIIAPIRRKRRRVGGVGDAGAESAPVEGGPVPDIAPAPESTAAESTAAPVSTAAPGSTSATRGILRKSAVRRFLKREFEFPMQVRDAFFVAAEAKIAEDLRRSVARALESKRRTLMTPDA